MSRFSLLDVLPLPEINLEIIDVCARHTEAERYQDLIGRNGVGITGFEPDAQQLQALKARYPDQRYLPYFLGDGSRRTFHHCHYGGCSSLYEPDPQVIDQFTSLGTRADSQFAVIKTEQGDTCRLDDIAEIETCHFLKSDVQGAELDVLRGAERLLSDVLVAELEVEFIPIYKNQPLFADVDTFMRAHGFLVHRLVDLSGRAFRPFVANGNVTQPVSQILWADAVYVRRFYEIGELDDDALLRFAVLLHDLYLSVDLCARALAHYDDRRNTELHTTYLREVAATGLEISFINVKDWTD